MTTTEGLCRYVNFTEVLMIPASGAAAEEREAPRRELERQMKMLPYRVDPEPEHGDIHKGWIGDRHARLAEERTDTELDFVGSSKHVRPVSHGTQEMSVRRTDAFGDNPGVRSERQECPVQTRDRWPNFPTVTPSHRSDSELQRYQPGCEQITSVTLPLSLKFTSRTSETPTSRMHLRTELSATLREITRSKNEHMRHTTSHN